MQSSQSGGKEYGNREELQYLGEICLRHHVIVVSDEIHNDFVYPGFEHTVFANVDPRFAEFTVTAPHPVRPSIWQAYRFPIFLSQMRHCGSIPEGNRQDRIR